MKPSSQKLPGVISVARIMYQLLTARFKFVWDPLASNFDGIYLASTFLNPAYRVLLEDTHLALAKEILVDLMKMKEDDHGVIPDGVEEMQALQEPDHT